MGRAAKKSEVRARKSNQGAIQISVGLRKKPNLMEEEEEEEESDFTSEDESQFGDRYGAANLPGSVTDTDPKSRLAGMDADQLQAAKDAEYAKKMQDMGRTGYAKKDEAEQKKLEEGKALGGKAREMETNIQSFLQMKTDDVDLQHRQNALASLTADAHQDRKLDKKEDMSTSDEEMVNAMEQVREAQRAMGLDTDVKDTVDILRDKLLVKNTWWSRLMFRKEMELRRRRQPDFVHEFPKVNALVNDLRFEAVVAFFMISNGVTLALGAERHPDGVPVYLTVFEHIFTFVFVVEAILRYMAYGWTWLLEFYNVCDLFLIFMTGVLAMWILEPMGIQSEFMRNFSILRLLRLLKLMRAVRAVPAFELVWRLIRVGIKCGKLLMWATIDAVFIVMLFGIFFTVLVGKHDSFVHDDTVLDLFGTVPRSAFTAWQIGTRCHWTTSLVRLARYAGNPWAWPLSLLCITSINLVLFNLVTASMIMAVMNETSSDKESARKLREAKKAAHWRILVNIFKAMDEDDSGEVSAQEVDHAMNNNPALMRRLTEINLHKAAMADLWTILDVNGDGKLDLEEFLDGMRQMEGSAKSYDLIRLNTRCSGLQKRTQKLGHWFMAVVPEAKRLCGMVDSTHSTMMDLFSIMRPVEKSTMLFIRLMAEEASLKTDEYGMPLVEEKAMEEGTSSVRGGFT